MTLRSSAPSIDIEMSGDSGDEGDRPFGQSPPNGHDNKHPHIPEEEETSRQLLTVRKSPAPSQSNPSSGPLYLPQLRRHTIPNLDLSTIPRWKQLLLRLHSNRSPRAKGHRHALRRIRVPSQVPSRWVSAESPMVHLLTPQIRLPRPS